MSKVQSYLDVLFDKDDHVCLGQDKLGTDLFHRQAVDENHPIYAELQYISINPLNNGDKREDKAVSAYRNFLVEFDQSSLDEQIAFVNQIKLPWSTAVFSGSKSMHFIVALDESLSNEATYRYVAKWIANIVRAGSADQNVFNPSRFTRIPEVLRRETGKKQTLVKVKRRVTHEELNAWLTTEENFKRRPMETKVTVGDISLSAEPWDVDRAITYCEDRWPLVPGEKNGHLMQWVRFMAGQCHLERRQILDLLHQCDQGKNREPKEYARAVARVFGEQEGTWNGQDFYQE